MKLNFTKIKHDKVLRTSTIISFVILSIFTAIILFFQGKLPPYIPLINNMPWGQERLLNKNILFLLPPIAIFTTLINIFMVSLLYEKNIFMSRVILFNTLLFNVLALLAMVQIILLVL